MDSNRTSRNYMAPVVRTVERSRTSSQHATATKNYKPQFIIKILNWESTKSVRGADTWLSIVNSGASSTASCQPAATAQYFIIGSTDLCNIQAGDHLLAEPATVTDQSANQLSLVHTLTMMIQFYWDLFVSTVRAAAANYSMRHKSLHKNIVIAANCCFKQNTANEC